MGAVGAEPEVTVVFEDMVFDIEMVRAAGFATLGVAWGCHPDQTPSDAGAQAIATDSLHLHDLIPEVLGRMVGP
ncbi:MAG: hypothetical protein GDA49_05195 [Rhodospirillales bacterium]|nr:hypothetical protein [Rhodospirillales bacterium]